MLQYSKILFAGALISGFIFLFIIVEKYNTLSHKPGYALNIILFALIVYSIAIPPMLYLQKNINGKGVLVGMLLLAGLFAELCLWVVLFHGISSLPSLNHLIYFFIPFALFILSTVFCLFLPPKKG
jgi:hypothetical protein